MGFGSNYAWSHYGKKIDDAVTEWLYGPYDKTKYNRFKQLYGLPGVHDYFDYLLDKRRDSEYLNRYNMSFNDIHDPRKVSQSSSGASFMGAGYRMVSRNVGSLYRSSIRGRSKKSKRRR